MVRLPALRRRRYFSALTLAATLVTTISGLAGQPLVAQAAEAVAYPTLYVQPSCVSVEEPGDLFIHGRNFARNRQVDVWNMYDVIGFDAEYGDLATVQTDDFGTFDVELPRDSHAASYYQISAVYSDSSSPDQSEASAIVGYCRARITALPRCGNEAFQVDVTATGFVESPVPVYFYIYEGDTDQIVGSTIYDALPTIEVSIPFEYSGPAPPGAYRVVATQGEDPFSSVQAITWFTVPCPTVTVEPDCAATGAPPDRLALTVTTTNFVNSPNYWGNYVEIVFDPGGDPQEFITEAANGVFTIRPYRRGSGTYTVLVKQGYVPGFVFASPWYDTIQVAPGWTDQQFARRTTSVQVPCPATPTPSPSPPPARTSLTLAPACGAPQLEGDAPQNHRLTLFGSGFVPGTVTLTFDPDGASERVSSAPVSLNRTFVGSVDVGALRDGAYRVVASQTVVGALVPDAEATYLVPCLAPAPLLTADTPCGPVATGLPAAYLINISGVGFLPGRVEITFDALGGVPEVMPPATADANGSFTAAISPGGRPPGTYEIRAHQQVAGSDLAADATAPFLVTCEGPAFRLVPDSGPPGFVVLVIGDAFPADADLWLWWDRGIRKGLPLIAHTDANGSFRRQVLVYGSDFAGLRNMRVQLAGDPLSFPSLVPAPYFVTTATVSPPFSLIENPIAAPDATIVLRR